MFKEAENLPTLKKEVKYTSASKRYMEVCKKAYESNTFVLLYFTNRKLFIKRFLEKPFMEKIQKSFTFLHLCRSEKAGNWFASTFQFKNTPFYSICDPSNGDFVRIHYGDVSSEELLDAAAHFKEMGLNYKSPICIFPEKLEENYKKKRRTTLTSGTKIRITFRATSDLPEKSMFINRTAPFSCAFEIYCSKMNIDINKYYFMYHGVQLPPDMTALQFKMKANDVIYVHLFEDKNSTELISITIIGIDNEETQVTVQKCRNVGSLLRTYCETHSIDISNYNFTIKGEIVDDSITFGEHNIQNNDKIIIEKKPSIHPMIMNHDLLYQFAMKPPEFQQIQSTPTVSIVPETYDMQHNPGVFFYQVSRTQPGISNPQFNQFQGSAYMVQTKPFQYNQKTIDNNHSTGNMWDNFE